MTNSTDGTGRVDDTIRIGGLMENAARAAAPVVRGVEDAQLGLPTPCAEYDVRALLNHLLHVVIGFQALAAKGTADFSTTPDYVAEGGWRDRFTAETRKLAGAWARPGTLEGVSGGFGMPQLTVAHMVLGDMTVHAWDLARATGQDFTPDGPALAELAPAFAELAPMARRMKVFGEPVPVPEGTPAFETLLAATGRAPDWSPRPANA
ncbi:TIGR03086 family metal-binding protein [Streptomyces sp. NPDC054796]